MSVVAATVMIVEDEPHIGALAADLSGARRVRDGLGALRRGALSAELERRAALALVVLDVGLPGIDGFEVCRRIAGRFR